jgi:PAS domain S-box-containing protein
MPARECWPETLHIIEPIYTRVSRGETVQLENAPFSTDRHGALEHAHFTLSYSPVRDDDEHIAGVLVTLIETTKVVRAQLVEAERARLVGELERSAAELRASEQRLRDIFEQAPVAVAVLSGPDHVYTTVSPRYAQMPGGGRPIRGRSVRDVFPELAGQGLIELLDRVYETGEPFFSPERLVRLDLDRDGVTEDYYFNIGYQPLRDADGQVYAVASVAYDVTDQIRERRELEIAREIAEDARHEAELANRAKSAFLTTMSHELRTPLNAVAGYADLLLLGVRGPLADGQREDLERIKRSGQYLLGLINDVLNFAKLDTGQVEYRINTVPVGPLLEGLEELIRPQVDAKGVRYRHGPCNADVAVRADPEKVRQILLNLLANAVKFTDAGGEVTVECHPTGSFIAIEVCDTGRGIPAGQLETIFDHFVQVDRHLTPMSQQGVGLGLAISRDLAIGMGGGLEATSQVGRGSRFTLTLPKA